MTSCLNHTEVLLPAGQPKRPEHDLKALITKRQDFRRCCGRICRRSRHRAERSMWLFLCSCCRIWFWSVYRIRLKPVPLFRDSVPESSDHFSCFLPWAEASFSVNFIGFISSYAYHIPDGSTKTINIFRSSFANLNATDGLRLLWQSNQSHLLWQARNRVSFDRNGIIYL